MVRTFVMQHCSNMRLQIVIFILVSLFKSYEFAISNVLSQPTTLSSPNLKSNTNNSTLLQSHVEIERDVHKLRSKGLEYLESRKYSMAWRCYAASLHVLAGHGSEELGKLRHRCALTLAECEIKLEKYEHAIITCSEVIDEAPDVNQTVPLSTESDSSDEEDDHSPIQILGKAYYKRGLALEKLKQMTLSLNDYEQAANLLPLNKKILYRRDTLRLSKSSANDTDSDLEDDIFDYIDYIMQTYPKEKISKADISSLLSTKKELANVKPSIESANPFASSMGNIPGLGGLGGLGGPLGLLGSLGGLGSSFNVGDMISLAGTMAGMNPSTISKVKDIVNEMTKAMKMYHSLMMSILSHKQEIILIVSAIWVIVAFQDPILNLLQTKFKMNK